MLEVIECTDLHKSIQMSYSLGIGYVGTHFVEVTTALGFLGKLWYFKIVPVIRISCS